MATMTRAKLSIKNKYYVDKHRYYELKHFCLQYNNWRRAYSELDGYSGQDFDGEPVAQFIPGDPTFKCVEKRMSYFNRMKLVEQAAIETDPELASYILKAVTEGLSYTYLCSKFDIPCGKDTYYSRYRRFFWLLDRNRD